MELDEGADYRDRYVVHMGDKFGSLALIDVDAEARAVAVPWFNPPHATPSSSM